MGAASQRKHSLYNDTLELCDESTLLAPSRESASPTAFYKNAACDGSPCSARTVTFEPNR